MTLFCTAHFVQSRLFASVIGLFGAIFWFGGTPLQAQPVGSQDATPLVHERFLQVGMFAGLSQNTHTANFQGLPGFPSCCPDFRTGSAPSAHGGLFAAIPFGSAFRFHIRLSYSDESAPLVAQERTVVADIRNGLLVVPAVFEHTIESTLQSVGIGAMLGYQPIRNLELLGGLRAGLVLGRTFRQTEVMIEPSDFGQYVGGGRTWIDQTGDIPDVSAIRITAVVGARYQLPLNRKGNIFLAPELMVHLPLTAVTSAVSWNITQLQPALGFGVELGGKPSSIPVQQIPEFVPAPPPVVFMPTPPTIDLTITTGQPNRPDLVMKIEETQVVDFHPLLGHVYFEPGTSTIPNRYLLGGKKAATDTTTLTPWEATHGVLGIVALRMAAAPDATITLVGNTSDETIDKGLELARARAEQVKQALISLGVSGNRIGIETRKFPLLPTKSGNASETEMANEENRRVEIVSKTRSITSPFVMRTVERATSVPPVTFFANVKSAAGVATTTLQLQQNTRQLYSQSFVGQQTVSTTWHGTTAETMPSGADPIRATVTATDSSGQTSTVERVIPITVNIEQAVEKRGTRSIERYSLILFDFNSEAVEGSNAQLLEYVRNRITPETTVRVLGYTDIMGADEYNRQLSKRRAEEVARLLRVANVQVLAVGEEQERFTNTLPEGRAYNRTVVIELIQSGVSE
jgi:outer membrane protein OmpA-like peptidoglycan-associated protein